MTYKHKPGGFTIVELIVVVTVIAIIAAISIFAFGSWRLRTAQTEMKNQLYSAANALKDYQNFNNSYPASLSTINFTTSSGVTMTYTRRVDGLSYCLNAGSTSVSTAAHWYIDSSAGATPSTTACS